MVFDVNATGLAYAEDDDYRVEGIEYIIAKLFGDAPLSEVEP